MPGHEIPFVCFYHTMLLLFLVHSFVRLLIRCHMLYIYVYSHWVIWLRHFLPIFWMVACAHDTQRRGAWASKRNEHRGGFTYMQTLSRFKMCMFEREKNQMYAAINVCIFFFFSVKESIATPTEYIVQWRQQSGTTNNNNTNFNTRKKGNKKKR